MVHDTPDAGLRATGWFPVQGKGHALVSLFPCSNSPIEIFIIFVIFMCVCAGGVWTDIGHRACGGQRTMSWSWFSPSTFLWVPGLNSGHQTVLTESSHWSPLFLKACTLFVDIFHSGPQLRTSLEETWDLHSGTLLIPWRLLKKD